MSEYETYEIIKSITNDQIIEVIMVSFGSAIAGGVAVMILTFGIVSAVNIFKETVKGG